MQSNRRRLSVSHRRRRNPAIHPAPESRSGPEGEVDLRARGHSCTALDICRGETPICHLCTLTTRLHGRRRVQVTVPGTDRGAGRGPTVHPRGQDHAGYGSVLSVLNQLDDASTAVQKPSVGPAVDGLARPSTRPRVDQEWCETVLAPAISGLVSRFARPKCLVEAGCYGVGVLLIRRPWVRIPAGAPSASRVSGRPQRSRCGSPFRYCWDSCDGEHRTTRPLPNPCKLTTRPTVPESLRGSTAWTSLTSSSHRAVSPGGGVG
jgi:hypothetical protein